MSRGLLLPALIVALGVGMWVPSNGAAVRATASDAAPLAALWEAPADLGARNLFDGSWGAKYAPDPHALYTFVRRKGQGTNPGVVVRDPSGRVWHVKQAPHTDQGEEGPVEVVLSRVLSAVGYHQPPVYLLPSFTMIDAGGSAHLEPGGRFRLEEPLLHHRGTWSWETNPFVGKRPYEGLLVILLIFNSWDLKDSNNALYDVQRNDRIERWYVVQDLGGALGESGSRRPKRNNIEKFERQILINGVEDGLVEFTYRGKQPDLVRHRIAVEDVRWASELLGGLSDRQWRDAFRAGGYTPDISDRFIRKIKANIAQGRHVGDDAWRSTKDRR